jgi:glycosyltransferase involved in cell wall biosynthesis
MGISIAVCTYNGAHFLQEQLTSLLNQTYLPDEVVVCDDQSTDSTLLILNTFKLNAPFPVHIHINSQRLYSTKNFEKAISLCQEDIIALCDQDDVWLPQKLEKVQQYFTKFPQISALFSDGLVVNSDLKSSGYTLWQHVKFTRSEQRLLNSNHALDVLLRRNVVTGATLVIKSSLKSQILPIPEEWVHDAWIAVIVAASNELAAIPEPLFLYRQHETNQIGASSPSWIQLINKALHTERINYYGKSISNYKTAYERVSAICKEDRTIALTKINAKLIHLTKRANLPSQRQLRVAPILKELFNQNYHRYSSDWKVAINDFLIPP